EAEKVLSRALALIEEAVRSAGVGDFRDLDTDGRERALRQVEAADAAAFETLVRHTYDGYYSHALVLTRLGLDTGPLHPRGHRVGAVAPRAELARVASRGSISRPA